MSRVLATVLFVDVANPPRTLIVSGPSQGRPAPRSFPWPCRAQRVGGATRTFDGPARAIRCVSSIVGELCAGRDRGWAGLHSGECEIAGDEVGGVAVQIARGVADLAGRGEVLVSQTVRDVVFGSAITFSSAGREC